MPYVCDVCIGEEGRGALGVFIFCDLITLNLSPACLPASQDKGALKMTTIRKAFIVRVQRRGRIILDLQAKNFRFLEKCFIYRVEICSVLREQVDRKQDWIFPEGEQNSKKLRMKTRYSGSDISDLQKIDEMSRGDCRPQSITIQAVLFAGQKIGDVMMSLCGCAEVPHLLQAWSFLT